MIGSWRDPVQHQHVAHDLRLGAAVRPRPLLSLTPGQQSERQRVRLLVHPVILDKRMVDVPQDQNRAHDGKA